MVEKKDSLKACFDYLASKGTAYTPPSVDQICLVAFCLPNMYMHKDVVDSQ